MAGKAVKRSRVHAAKLRLQTGKSRLVAETAETAVKAAPTAVSQESDRPPKKQRGTNTVKPLRRPRVPSQVTQGLRFLAAPLVWLCLLAFCGGTGVAAFLWLTTLPPIPSCHMPSPATDSDQLYCAEQAARSGKVEALLAGLALVKNWSPDHPLRHRANRDVTEWSKSLLAIAETKVGQGDLAGAIALAKKIPASSSLHADVQTALLGWQTAQNRGQAINTAIQRALKQQDWQTATVQIQALTRLDDEYARQNLSRLRQQLITERTAYQQLQQARQIATSAPEDVVAVGKAIALAERLPLASYARSAAQLEIQTWGQFLLNRLTDQLGQSNLAGAIVTAQALPFSLPLPPVVRDLVWLGRAQPLANHNQMIKPPSEQFWQLWLPLSQVRQIRADSPLAAQTKALTPQLEQQTQDLLQIQLALTVARLKQLPTLQSAIALVQPITPDRPRRLYAQTLIAQWRKEIQQIEDRPYLVQAQQLAAAGTLPKLKAAIAQAQQVALGRALRLEAQNAIAKWTRQIQTIEDQPILNQARALAKQNKLTEAIQTANKIRVDRALYKDAQASANDWIAQIQIAQDQSLLDEARALADRGRLTRAISLASEIGYGRALYNDAQSAIARWSDQRDTILRARRRDEPSPSPEPYRPSSDYNSPVEAPAPLDLPPP
ncbi:MAG: hypothetical protein RBJ76_25110 [Stenomitos frigidus ULC029]